MITLRSQTDNSHTTGTFSMTSDKLYAAITALTMAKGMVARVWGWRVSGAAAVVTLNFLKTSTGTPVPHNVISFDPTLDSQVQMEKLQRPIEIRAPAGDETLTWTWAQGVAGYTYVEFDIELIPDA